MERNAATETTAAVKATLRLICRAHACPARIACSDPHPLTRHSRCTNRGKPACQKNQTHDVLCIPPKRPSGHKQTWKHQDVWDQDKRREEISTRNHEYGTRAQNGKLGVQQDRGDRIVDEHRRHISRDEGVEPGKPTCHERTKGDQDKDDQHAEHEGKSQPLLRRLGDKLEKTKCCPSGTTVARLLYRSGDGRIHLPGAPATSGRGA